MISASSTLGGRTDMGTHIKYVYNSETTAQKRIFNQSQGLAFNSWFTESCSSYLDIGSTRLTRYPCAWRWRA